MMILLSLPKPTPCFCFFLLFLLLHAPAVEAGILSVDSANVEQGEWSAESGLVLERDDLKRADNFREYEFELGYSPTDYWNTGVEFSLEREQGAGTRYVMTGWKNTFRFLKQSETMPVSAGVRLEYAKSHIADDADKFSMRLLLNCKIDKLEARFNIGGKREVGADKAPGVNGDVRASARYQVNDKVAVALDYLGDTGSLHNVQSFKKQDHRIGPVLYGSMTDMLDYELGMLMGISHNAPDYAFKFGLEYSF